MADTTGFATSALIEDLLSHGHEFTFHQVMRIARMHLAAGGAQDLPEISWQERVRVRPELSLAFPAADVSRVERAGDDGMGLLVTATFLGLYGTSSPLPTHYSEDLLDEAAADVSLTRDFLDILHQRLYQLYFQCWSKYRLFLRVAEERDSEELERLFCLIGLGEKELRQSVPDAESLLRYIGLFSQPRSALGLRTLLRDALAVDRLEIEQFVPRQVPIPTDQQTRLGMANNRLGVDTILGNQMPDRMGKFRIQLGPLSRKELDSFLPGTPSHQKLARLTKLYIVDPFDFDLRLILAAEEAEPIRLGDPDAPRLGLNSWCFSGANLREVSAIFPLSEEASTAVTSKDEVVTSEEAGGAKTLTDYYQRELARLRDLAVAYPGSHPEIASLVSGHLADSSVERLFEGVAFLNANLQRKLDDDLPEITDPLIEAFLPWALRPIPAATIIAFAPKAELSQPLVIPAGAEVVSIPVRGSRCRFRTCHDVTVQPLSLVDGIFTQPAGQPPCIKLQCQLNGISLSDWQASSLRFFLGDDHKGACDLYLLLMRYLKRVVIRSTQTGATIEMPPECLKPVGFEKDEGVLPSESVTQSGHQTLQEYFLFPDKFLFIELNGLEACSTLGDGTRFEICFELAPSPPVMPQITKDSFVLFATPVINLFSQKAKPLTLENDQPQKIQTASEHHQIYSVDRIAAFEMGTVRRRDIHSRSALFSGSDVDPLCNITRVRSSTGEGEDTYASMLHGNSDTDCSRLKLNIDLTCTNGVLPEQLNLGDVRISTAAIPEAVTFRNVKPVTGAVDKDAGRNGQWKLLAGSTLNRTCWDTAENLRSILKPYIATNSSNQAAVKANQKRVDAVETIEVTPTDRLLGDSMCRGYDLRIRLRGDNFGGPGDLYMFSSVLERFLSNHVTTSCFIRVSVEEVSGLYRFEWPMHLRKSS